MKNSSLLAVLLGGFLTCVPLIYLDSQNIIKISASSQEVEKNTTTTNKDAEQFENPMNDRAIAVAGHIALQGLPHDEKSREYVHFMEKEIEADIKDLLFYTKFSMITGTNHVAELTDETTVKVFKEWEIKFTHANTPLLKQFPSAPFLAVNHEIIKQPNCENNDDAFIYWGKATRNKESWTEAPIIWDNKETKEWLIKFNDIEPLDKRAYDRRLLIIAGCKSDEKATDKTTTLKTPEKDENKK